jgi:hypothetical protein
MIVMTGSAPSQAAPNKIRIDLICSTSSALNLITDERIERFARHLPL